MSAHILLVEDSNTEAELISEAIRDSEIDCVLEHFNDGEEAVRSMFARDQDPDLVLLDLNLPKISGTRILKMMRNSMRLRKIPVIILTNSDSPSDVIDAYANGANAYLHKPLEFDKFVDMFRSMKAFWFESVTLPG